MDVLPAIVPVVQPVMGRNQQLTDGVLAGVSAQVPVVTRISPLPLEAEPNSRTMSVVDEWLSPLIIEPIDDELSDVADLSDADWPVEPPF